MTWDPHIGFKDTPQGVFEAMETISFVFDVLWISCKFENWPKSSFLSIFGYFTLQFGTF